MSTAEGVTPCESHAESEVDSVPGGGGGTGAPFGPPGGGGGGGRGGGAVPGFGTAPPARGGGGRGGGGALGDGGGAAFSDDAFSDLLSGWRFFGGERVRSDPALLTLLGELERVRRGEISSSSLIRLEGGFPYSVNCGRWSLI
jgi:hypothetical protein